MTPNSSSSHLISPCCTSMVLILVIIHSITQAYTNGDSPRPTLATIADSSTSPQHTHGQCCIKLCLLVYPNILEGKKLITGMAKQIAAFTLGHLGDNKVDVEVLFDFLRNFVDPPMSAWKWSLWMRLRDTDISDSIGTGQKFSFCWAWRTRWWKDVIEQYKWNWEKPGKPLYAF